MHTTKAKKALRAAIYIRVSGDDQKKGYGPDIQLAETKRQAIDVDRCTVRKEHIFIDAKSGSTDDRDGWRRILEAARRQEIDVVYFWKLDRMMRDEYYFFVNERELKDLNVELRFATQNLDDPLNRAIQVAIAADERRKITERTYKGRCWALRDGKWVARIPYGYCRDKNTGGLKINPEEAKWVRQIYQWFVDDQLSLTALGKRLYEHNVPTQFDAQKRKKYRYGYGFWSKGHLSRLLHKEYYATGKAWFHKYTNPDLKRFGLEKLRPKEDWIGVPVPPLIPMELYRRAQRQLIKNREYARGNTKRSYLFSKKLVCGACRLKLCAMCRPDREHAKIYRGENWQEERCTECRYYLERDLDAAIWRGIIELFEDPDGFLAKLQKYQKRGSNEINIRKEESELSKQDEDIERQERLLLEYDLNRVYSKQVLSIKQKELQSRKKRNEERRQELEKFILTEESRVTTVSSAQNLHVKIKKQLDNPSYDNRKIIYEMVLEKIVLYRSRAEVHCSILGSITSQHSSGLTTEGASKDDGLRRIAHKNSDANGAASSPFVFSVRLTSQNNRRHLRAKD